MKHCHSGSASHHALNTFTWNCGPLPKSREKVRPSIYNAAHTETTVFIEIERSMMNAPRRLDRESIASIQDTMRFLAAVPKYHTLSYSELPGSRGGRVERIPDDLPDASCRQFSNSETI